jgi:D-amino-acid dehydrogenase
MPNMMPRVGSGHKANVFYNTGHGHLGWTLSAITADMVGDVVSQAVKPVQVIGSLQRV